MHIELLFIYILLPVVTVTMINIEFKILKTKQTAGAKERN